jgi:hypothetical protein
MTNHQIHPTAHGTTLPIYHPKPVVHPRTPANNGIIPGRSGAAGLPGQFVSQKPVGHPHISVDNGFIPGRSSIAGLPPHHPVQLAGHIGHLGVQLRSATHTGGPDSTRAHLHAQAIIAAMQQELSHIGTRNVLSPRIHSLQKELDQALHQVAQA